MSPGCGPLAVERQRAADDLLDQPQDLVDRHPGPAADVIDAPGDALDGPLSAASATSPT